MEVVFNNCSSNKKASHLLTSFLFVCSQNYGVSYPHKTVCTIELTTFLTPKWPTISILVPCVARVRPNLDNRYTAFTTSVQGGLSEYAYTQVMLTTKPSL